MKITDFDYILPPEKIAIYPPKVRGSTKLLVLDRQNGQIKDDKYANFFNYLQDGDVLVLNNTKVFNARLIGTKASGSKIELVLLENHGEDPSKLISKAIYKGKISIGEIVYFGTNSATVLEIFENGIANFHFSVDVNQVVFEKGQTPIPPYLGRSSDKADTERYQTTFASNIGSVAAPTASLNFTPELAAILKQKGIKIVELTLHVGLGTFLPIRTDNIDEHIMHSEYFDIPKTTVETIQNAKKSGHKIYAIGTTVTRTLEYNAQKILGSIPQNLVGEADIFIYPGYQFQVVDGLLTNFHAPKSTVLMLAAAFASWQHLEIGYKHALQNDYSFLSYGDSMLIR
jgi:S-adenosylmethionine:tRNA ribosyltransferase-isomerase